MTSDEEVSRQGRQLRNLIEPIAGCVYFAPEVQWAFAELGLPTTPAADGASAWETHESGAAAYGPQYFCSRSACMGRLSGDAVAAVFGLFEPATVRRAVDEGWEVTGPDAVLQARLFGVERALGRMLKDDGDSLDSKLAKTADMLFSGIEEAVMAAHPIAAGLAGLPIPKTPLGRLWRAADILREHRGDSHNNAWAAFGLDPIEVGVLTELVRGLPITSHVRTRAWSETDINQTLSRLRSKGFIEEDGITDRGKAVREEVELATDRQERRIIERLHPHLSELFGTLFGWSEQILDQDGYHVRPETLMGPGVKYQELNDAAPPRCRKR